MTKKNRIAAVLLTVMVFVVMLYSTLLIAAEADHDCVGEGCPICHQINACRKALKNLSLAVCTAAFAAVFAYALCRTISACADVTASYTLVSLKVKLTD